jgi:hypothetical protein
MKVPQEIFKIHRMFSAPMIIFGFLIDAPQGFKFYRTFVRFFVDGKCYQYVNKGGILAVISRGMASSILASGTKKIMGLCKPT